MSRLRYVNTSDLDIIRVKSGKSFRYLKNGRPIQEKGALDRIEKLALPPAWKSVRLSSSPNAHLQAIGIDAKGRKQYRYHELWTKHRNETKFHRMVAFAKALPTIRLKIKRNLSKPGLCREKVLAAAIDILQKTNIRVGNEIYTKTNHSYGLTTLTNGHAKVRGSKIHLHFRAKSGKYRNVELTDQKLGKILRKCQELPGQKLFEYVDRSGQIRKVTSSEINRYILELCGDHFTAKDFRTWCGTIRALELIKSSGQFKQTSDRAWRKRHLEIIRKTAEFLGNTPSICEKYYIHPNLFNADRANLIFSKKRRSPVPGLTELESLSLGILLAFEFPSDRLKKETRGQ